MECFNYYKELFSEYNNNETFEIISIGEESYFLPIEEHIENLSYAPIFNANGVIDLNWQLKWMYIFILTTMKILMVNISIY